MHSIAFRVALHFDTLSSLFPRSQRFITLHRPLRRLTLSLGRAHGRSARPQHQGFRAKVIGSYVVSSARSVKGWEVTLKALRSGFGSFGSSEPKPGCTTLPGAHLALPATLIVMRCLASGCRLRRFSGRQLTAACVLGDVATSSPERFCAVLRVHLHHLQTRRRAA